MYTQFIYVSDYICLLYNFIQICFRKRLWCVNRFINLFKFHFRDLAKAKKKKNCLLVLVRPTVLSGPTVKVFFYFFFFNFFIQIQNYIIRKHYWNCQQSITHVRIGNRKFRSLQDRIRHSLIFMTIISGVGNTVANMADAMDTTDVCTRSP